MLSTNEIRDGVSKAVVGYPVKSIKMFGSYAEGKQTENSDVDLLVEFFMPHVSLFTISGLQIKLEELLGKDVDLIHAPIPEGSLLDIRKTVDIYEA